jgi:hypothetical protein
MNLGLAHSLALQAPTLVLYLEITKNRKFVIKRIHLMKYKILISSFYFSASQNGTTRQTGETWC